MLVLIKAISGYRSKYLFRNKKRWERLRYKGRQSIIAALVNVFKILGEKSYSVVKVTKQSL